MLIATRSSYFTEGIQISTNDTDWMETQTLSRDFHYKVSLAGKLIVAAGTSELFTSADGFNWSESSFTNGADRMLYAATAVGPRLVAVGVGAAISDDNGVTWTWNDMGQQSFEGFQMNGVAWSGTALVAVGNDGTILTSR
jgi:hypothetical protein